MTPFTPFILGTRDLYRRPQNPDESPAYDNFHGIGRLGDTSCRAALAVIAPVDVWRLCKIEHQGKGRSEGRRYGVSASLKAHPHMLRHSCGYAMTCEKPSESERPISHWSQREIADEAIRRGLVSNISQRSVRRFLKRGRPQTASLSLLADAKTRSCL
jgi:hypothetical protein